jgi:hypothetical protein
VRRLAVAAAAAALLSPAGAQPGASALAELTRRAEAILVARPLGSPAPGIVRFQVEEGIRGWEGPIDVRHHPGVADEFDATGAAAWLLYLGRRGAPAGAFAVQGGERGALRLEGIEGLALLEAARALAGAADLADERLLGILVEQLGSFSARVREDAAEELARLPRALRVEIPPSRLAEAVEREDGPTPARAAVLRLFAARSDVRDLPALLREVEGGPEELLPLLAHPFREIEGGPEALAGAIDGGRGPRRPSAARLLGEVGGEICAARLRAALADPGEETRLAAIEGLGRIPGNGEALLLVLAAGTETEQRLAARSILLGGTAEDRAVLRALAPSSPSVRAVLDVVTADPFFLHQPKNR